MGKHYDQLDLDDRIEISRLHVAGRSRREIGRLMGRDASTISRELRRNSLPRGKYMPASANRIARSRCRRTSRIERLSLLRAYVCDHFAKGWSPEQIVGRLRLEGSEHSISDESIYRFICRPPRPDPSPHHQLGYATRRGLRGDGK
jgi:IS30 family transposase